MFAVEPEKEASDSSCLYYDFAKTVSLEEAEAIRTLHRETVHALDKYFSKKQIAAWTIAGAGDYRRVIEGLHSFYRFYDREKNLIGFTGLPYPGFLRFLYVHPQHQRRGYGARILSFIEKNRFHLTARKTLGVHANVTAVAFYLKQGYNVIGQYDLDLNGAHFRMKVMEKEIKGK